MSLGVQGIFGKVPFTCSSYSVSTFKDLSIKHSARFATHDVLGQMPVNEYIGPAQDTINFKMTFNQSLNAPPSVYVALLESMLKSGESHILCFGAEYMGKYILTGFDEDRKFFNGLGMPIITDVTVSLKSDKTFSLLSAIKSLLS